ncbi:hypothetical protein J8281_12110 [Aquimarina sp. U1-2]|uniref:hypothetical protein n=1 Tax=Aquimarina sp. U1-2 TaxID=2823141 RepID=UPI001AECF021|nr:hypothetical protein [Aquimarina sp. U1-2]MBP2832931.1 hypothetical protein [Aquimarina sp. U1-2]
MLINKSCTLHFDIFVAMMKRTCTFHIAFFLLFVFSCLRVVNLHAYIHVFGEETEHCEQCEFLYQSEKNNPLSPSLATSDNKVFSICRTELTEFSIDLELFVKKTILYDYVFNKPPPSI